MQSTMVEGGLLLDLPVTRTSTFGRSFFTSSEVLAGVPPRGLAEVRRSGPVLARIWEKIKWSGMRRPTERKWSK